jgi:hypothetical protein
MNTFKSITSLRVCLTAKFTACIVKTIIPLILTDFHFFSHVLPQKFWV